MRVFGFLLNLSLAVVVVMALALVPVVGCGDDDDRLPGECGDGPLSAPIVPCQPTPVPDTGDPYADCVARINQFRADCQCLPPLERWTDGESCADEHAQSGKPAELYRPGESIVM